MCGHIETDEAPVTERSPEYEVRLLDYSGQDAGRSSDLSSTYPTAGGAFEAVLASKNPGWYAVARVGAPLGEFESRPLVEFESEWSTVVGRGEAITTRLEVRGPDVYSVATNSRYPDAPIEWVFEGMALAEVKAICEAEYHTLRLLRDIERAFDYVVVTE